MYSGNIQSLRGMAAWMILFSHLFLFGSEKYGLQSDMFAWWGRALTCGVDIFFVISGYIIALVSHQSLGAKNAYSFILRRFARVYPTYWVIFFALLPFYIYQPSWFNSSSNIPVSLVHSFLLIPHESVPLLMVSWTLEYEIYFYVIYFLLVWFVVQKHRHIMVACIFVLSVLLGFVVNRENSWLYMMTDPLLLEFTGGCLIYYYSKHVKNVKPIIWAFFGVLAVFLFSQSQYVDQWRFVRFGLLAIWFVSFFIYLEAQGFTTHKFIRYMGDISYSLYLVHVPIIAALGKLWLHIDAGAFLPVWGLLCLMFAGALGAAALLHHAVDLPVQKYWKNSRVLCLK